VSHRALSYDDAVEEYLHWLIVEKGRSVATIEAYRRDLEALVAHLSARNVDLDAVGEADLASYYQQLRGSGRARASINRALSSTRGWFSFLTEEAHLEQDPASRLRAGQRARSLPKPLTEENVNALLESVPQSSPSDCRDRAILEFLYGTGVRVSELTGVRLGDLDFDENLVRVTGKGAKQRLVPLGRSLVHALDNYLERGRPAFVSAVSKDALFLNSRGGPLTRQGVDLIVHRRALEAGLDTRSVSAHVFRHSCATHMLAHGADVRVVQELLGHSSIATTQVYTGVTLGTLRRSYLSAHPRAAG